MSEKVESHSGVRFHRNGPEKSGDVGRHQRNNSESAATTSSSASANREGRLIPSRVFVGNIPSQLVERDLGMLFNRFGKIRDVKIIPEHSRNKSYGFVTFFSEADARRAIQSSLQQDCVMWGDRKLNVAPAIKRNNNNNSPTPTVNSFYRGMANQLGVNSATFYPNPLHVSTPALFAPAESVGHQQPQQPQQQPQQMTAVEPIAMDGSNNGLYQTAVICRLPHQYMSQCQYPSAPGGHYFVTPGYQPYMPGTANVGANMPTAHFTAAPYPNYPSQDNYRPAVAVSPTAPSVLTPPRDGHSSSASSSSGSSTNNTITDGLSDGEDGNGNQDKNNVHQELLIGDVTEAVHHHPTMNPGYHMPTAMICCAHHSCMMSPLPSQPPGVARSCLAGCYSPASPLIAYNSPVMYGRRTSAARLQRWSSLDANLSGMQQQWGNEAAWSRPSLGDSYGSETALFPPRQPQQQHFDRPLRPAFSCQSHGMFSPFCHSYEYNLWGVGQGQQQFAHQQHMEHQATDPVHSGSLDQVNDIPVEQAVKK